MRRVDRVIGDLRRGLVAIVEGDSAALALQAAETTTAASLAQLASLDGGKLSLALTRRRAAALGLTATPSEPRGSSVLALPRDTQPHFVHTLADPGAAVAGLGVDAPDGDRLVDAAIELVKLTRLLPAAVIVSLTPAVAKRI
ncbi:MAG TPA: GTP cyclohydrolase II, partial [Stellaceae bacterium]|nr:GTP cyclohydrolase II [Stellaceae bacterium]